MSFSTSFSLHTALGGLVGYGWFVLPGLLVQRLASRQDWRARWSFAPLLGLATFGPVSLLVFHFVPMQWPWLVASWVLFNGGLLRLGRREPSAAREPEGWSIQLGCAAIAVIPCLSIYPFVHEGALYTGSAIHDHARVAFIDAIVRHGLPPLNPIFAPGQDAVFNYYYLWLFAAAQLRVLAWIPGWPADVALTWFTFLAVSSACAGIALELGRRRAVAWSVVVLVASGPLVNAWPWLREQGWAPRNGLATAVGQGAWSPHHLLAAGAIVLATYLFARAAEGGERGWDSAFVLGSLLACAFGCSVWLAFGLVVSVPFLALALIWNRRERVRTLGGPALLVARLSLIAFGLCVPVLIGAVAGPFAYSGAAVAFDLHRSLPRTSPAWLQFGAFWLYAAPVAYGVSYVLGLVGVVRAIGRGPGSMFAALSLAAIAGFLLVTQVLRSVVMNNDLGWRAHTVANLLLVVWSAILIGQLLERRRWWVLTPVAALAAAGLYAAPLALPGPAKSEPAAVRAERTRFLVQSRAWEIVRRHAGPNDLVQANPYAFNQLSPWPLNLGFMLFADRRSVFAHPNWVRTYAHNLPPDLLPTFERIVSNAFSKTPEPRLLQTLRDAFRVKVLLVDPADGAWSSRALDRSPIYERVHADPMFRVYRAKRE